MKTIILALAIILFCSVLSFGQTVSLLESYEIPTYSYNRLTLGSGNLISYNHYEEPDLESESKRLAVMLELENSFFNQTPAKTISTDCWTYFRYNSSKASSSSNNYSYKNLNMRLMFNRNANWYLKDDKGVFINSGVGISNMFNFWDNDDNTFISSYSIPIGIGYGRVIGVKNVVQAYIIAKEIGADLSNESLLKLAEIIEKYNNDYYTAEFRDDAEIEFYNDLAEITGKPEKAMKIRQILNSPIYKTSERFTGWHIKGGVYNNLINGGDLSDGFFDDIDYRLDLFASLRYTLPTDYNKQLILSLNYSKNLKGGDKQSIYGSSANFTIDHKYKWSSSLVVDYVLATQESASDLKNLIISLQSDYVLLNSLSVNASVNYQRTAFYDHQFNTTLFPFHLLHRNNENSFGIRLGFRFYLI